MNERLFDRIPIDLEYFDVSMKHAQNQTTRRADFVGITPDSNELLKLVTFVTNEPL